MTGATGFIGSHVLPMLAARGFEVHASTRRTDAPVTPGVTWHPGDLLHGAESDRLMRLVRPTHLLHLAWYVQPGAFWAAPENVSWVAASLALLQSFHRSGGRRAVVTGTCAEYDLDGGPCREGVTPLAPATLYGAAKHGLHVVGEAYTRSVGMSLAWGRVFLLYGPGEPAGRLVPAITRALLLGVPAPCSRGEQRRDFLHVVDVAAALALLVEGEVDGPVDIASGVAVPVREVVSTIAGIIGRPELVQWGAMPSPEGDPALIVGDPTRLTQELAWRPTRSLPDGLADTVAWWRDRLEHPESLTRSQPT